MPLPSFLCIGAQKAATSWLFSRLSQHPEVWMPPIKELHYFDHLYVPEVNNWSHFHLKANARTLIKAHVTAAVYVNLAYVQYLTSISLNDVFTEQWYKRAFAYHTGKDKCLGDITPEYCSIPPEGLQYVKSLLGDIKIIYLIRDPRSRALIRKKTATKINNRRRQRTTVVCQ
ncbi:hypothetical protein EYC87_16040 [Halieaceae bacterium IMCC8485]|uniref:Sulfotransferase n=1 Tax=Candidatus Seongchinamella marina TaxID=2518990 RepID=A0ABT3SYN1_9GAMM|nr:sulfotransferase [Candidatus Seongchinamella marina]MCX2975099.1 hypothetical protein [Candidatus Seongchinamella marina]